MVQAYHNELVGKVSRLEEENVKLKKEKVSNPIHVLFFIFCFTQRSLYLLYRCLYFLLLVNLLSLFVVSCD